MPGQKRMVPVQGVDEMGVIRDVPAHGLPPQAWSDGRNVRFKSGAVHKREGTVHGFSELPNTQTHAHIAYWPEPTTPQYVEVRLDTSRDFRTYTGDGATTLYNIPNAVSIIDVTVDGTATTAYTPDFTAGTISLNTTPASGDVIVIRYNATTSINPSYRIYRRLANDSVDEITPTDAMGGLSNLIGIPQGRGSDFGTLDTGDWQSTLFTGGYNIILNNGFHTPAYINRDNNDLTPLPGWNYQMDRFVSAKVIRGIGNRLIAGNLSHRLRTGAMQSNSLNFPGTIRVSSPAPNGRVPGDPEAGDNTPAFQADVAWDFSQTASLAEEFEISNTNAVQDIVNLQGQAVIYTNQSIHVLQFAGGNLSVRNVAEGYGALTTNSVIEFDGRHFVVGSDDIYIFGGHPGSIQSIADSKIRDFFFADLSPLTSENLFVVRDRGVDEIQVYYPSVLSVDGTCDRYIAWNYRNQTWSINDTPRVTNNEGGAVSGTVGPVRGGGVVSGEIPFAGFANVSGTPRAARPEIQSFTVDVDTADEFTPAQASVQSLTVRGGGASTFDTQVFSVAIDDDIIPGQEEQTNITFPGNFNSGTPGRTLNTITTDEDRNNIDNSGIDVDVDPRSFTGPARTASGWLRDGFVFASAYSINASFTGTPLPTIGWYVVAQNGGVRTNPAYNGTVVGGDATVIGGNPTGNKRIQARYNYDDYRGPVQNMGQAPDGGTVARIRAYEGTSVADGGGPSTTGNELARLFNGDTRLTNVPDTRVSLPTVSVSVAGQHFNYIDHNGNAGAGTNLGITAAVPQWLPSRGYRIGALVAHGCWIYRAVNNLPAFDPGVANVSGNLPPAYNYEPEEGQPALFDSENWERVFAGMIVNFEVTTASTRAADLHNPGTDPRSVTNIRLTQPITNRATGVRRVETVRFNRSNTVRFADNTNGRTSTGGKDIFGTYQQRGRVYDLGTVVSSANNRVVYTLSDVPAGSNIVFSVPGGTPERLTEDGEIELPGTTTAADWTLSGDIPVPDTTGTFAPDDTALQPQNVATNIGGFTGFNLTSNLVDTATNYTVQATNQPANAFDTTNADNASWVTAVLLPTGMLTTRVQTFIGDDIQTAGMVDIPQPAGGAFTDVTFFDAAGTELTVDPRITVTGNAIVANVGGTRSGIAAQFDLTNVDNTTINTLNTNVWSAIRSVEAVDSAGTEWTFRRGDRVGSFFTSTIYDLGQISTGSEQVTFTLTNPAGSGVTHPNARLRLQIGDNQEFDMTDSLAPGETITYSSSDVDSTRTYLVGLGATATWTLASPGDPGLDTLGPNPFIGNSDTASAVAQIVDRVNALGIRGVRAVDNSPEVQLFYSRTNTAPQWDIDFVENTGENVSATTTIVTPLGMDTSSYRYFVGISRNINRDQQRLVPFFREYQTTGGLPADPPEGDLYQVRTGTGTGATYQYYRRNATPGLRPNNGADAPGGANSDTYWDTPTAMDAFQFQTYDVANFSDNAEAIAGNLANDIISNLNTNNPFGTEPDWTRDTESFMDSGFTGYHIRPNSTTEYTVVVEALGGGVDDGVMTGLGQTDLEPTDQIPDNLTITPPVGETLSTPLTAGEAPAAISGRIVNYINDQVPGWTAASTEGGDLIRMDGFTDLNNLVFEAYTGGDVNFIGFNPTTPTVAEPTTPIYTATDAQNVVWYIWVRAANRNLHISRENAAAADWAFASNPVAGTDPLATTEWTAVNGVAPGTQTVQTGARVVDHTPYVITITGNQGGATAAWMYDYEPSPTGRRVNPSSLLFEDETVSTVRQMGPVTTVTVGEDSTGTFTFRDPRTGNAIAIPISGALPATDPQNNAVAMQIAQGITDIAANWNAVATANVVTVTSTFNDWVFTDEQFQQVADGNFPDYLDPAVIRKDVPRTQREFTRGVTFQTPAREDIGFTITPDTTIGTPPRNQQGHPQINGSTFTISFTDSRGRRVMINGGPIDSGGNATVIATEVEARLNQVPSLQAERSGATVSYQTLDYGQGALGLTIQFDDQTDQNTFNSYIRRGSGLTADAIFDRTYTDQQVITPDFIEQFGTNDPARPWQVNQFNRAQEYVVLASKNVFDSDGTTILKPASVEVQRIGYTWGGAPVGTITDVGGSAPITTARMGVPYYSYVERIQNPIDNQVEFTKGIDYIQVLTSAPINRDNPIPGEGDIAVTAVMEDAPGAVVDLQPTFEAPGVTEYNTKVFERAEDYKIDWRLHGRLYNFRFGDTSLTGDSSGWRLAGYGVSAEVEEKRGRGESRTN